MSKVILVTGGSGLVGQAIKHVLNDPNGDPLFKAREDETWYFASSKDGDLRCVFLFIISLPSFLVKYGATETQSRQRSYSKSTSRHM